jgi:hypothetical protein
MTFTSIVLSIAGAPSDERSGLSLVTVISYIAGERTTKKTPSPIPLLLDDVVTGMDPKENASTVAWLCIVACLSVAIATVVNTCYIAYSIHVTILLNIYCVEKCFK